MIVAGPSGVGKTHVSYPLVQRFSMPLVEIDDVFLAVEAMRRPAEQPLIHYWRNPS